MATRSRPTRRLPPRVESSNPSHRASTDLRQPRRRYPAASPGRGHRMSMHGSFASKGGMSKHRNVLTRTERIEKLKADGRWSAEKGVTNLPKVRNIKLG